MSTSTKCIVCGNSKVYAKNICKRCYNNKRNRDPIQNEINHIADNLNKNKRRKEEICKIIKQHHVKMKDDSERLTIDFIQNLINVNCDTKESENESL